MQIPVLLNWKKCTFNLYFLFKTNWFIVIKYFNSIVNGPHWLIYSNIFIQCYCFVSIRNTLTLFNSIFFFFQFNIAELLLFVIFIYLILILPWRCENSAFYIPWSGQMGFSARVFKATFKNVSLSMETGVQ